MPAPDQGTKTYVVHILNKELTFEVKAFNETHAILKVCTEHGMDWFMVTATATPKSEIH